MNKASARRCDDVLVVGGGVIGMSIAESLAIEGLRVRVFESERVGSGASGAAAGMLAPLSEAREDGPLLRLGMEGLHRLGLLCDRLKDETGIDPELEASGLVQIAMSEAEAASLINRKLMLEGLSVANSGRPPVAFEWLDSGQVLHEEPEISLSNYGGLRSPLECHLRPPLLMRALEKSALNRGVEIESGVRAMTLRREGARVIGVQSSVGRFEADAVVVAAGPWSPGLIEASGVVIRGVGDLPVEPVRGQILSLEGRLPRTREIVWGGGVYFVPKRDGSWIVGATEERVGFDRRVTAAGVAWLLERARSVFPGLGAATFGQAWAGLRPVSGDGLPWIGSASDWPGLFLGTGHGRNGILLSAITAERIRDEILGKRPLDPSDPFRVGRGAQA
jgi:glycine oxidase